MGLAPASILSIIRGMQSYEMFSLSQVRGLLDLYKSDLVMFLPTSSKLMSILVAVEIVTQDDREFLECDFGKRGKHRISTRFFTDLKFRQDIVGRQLNLRGRLKEISNVKRRLKATSEKIVDVAHPIFGLESVVNEKLLDKLEKEKAALEVILKTLSEGVRESYESLLYDMQGRRSVG